MVEAALPINMYFGSNEDIELLQAQDKILTKRRGHSFKLPPKNSNVIVLFSGGIDSVSLVHLLAKKHQYNIYPVYYVLNKENKGQKRAIQYFNNFFLSRFPHQYHPVETRKFTQLFSFRDVPFYMQKALENFDLITENTSYYPPIEGYQTFFPNNPTRLGHYAFGAYDFHLYLRYKKGLIANTAFTAITYSDTLMRECNLSVIRSVNIAIGSITGDYTFQFAAVNEKKANFCLTKDQLAQHLAEDNVPVYKTWSCVFRQNNHCGICQSCVERKALFSKLKIEDKTTYSNRQQRVLLQRVKNRLTRLLHKQNPVQQPRAIFESDPLVTITDTYGVNNALRTKKTKEGLFVYVMTTKVYCLFSNHDDIELITYVIGKETVSFTDFIRKRGKSSQIFTKNTLSKFIKLCLSSEILFKLK